MFINIDDKDIQKILIGSNFFFIFLLIITGLYLIYSYNKRYSSVLLSNLLQNTIDIRTLNIRNYIVTGEEKYKNRYISILDIISNNENANWYNTNLDLDGSIPNNMKYKPYLIIIKDAGFTKDEISVFRQALSVDDDLSWLEIESINWYNGKIDIDGQARERFDNMKTKRFITFLGNVKDAVNTNEKTEQDMIVNNDDNVEKTESDLTLSDLKQKAIDNLYTNNYLKIKENIRQLCEKGETMVNERVEGELRLAKLIFILSISILILLNILFTFKIKYFLN